MKKSKLSPSTIALAPAAFVFVFIALVAATSTSFGQGAYEGSMPVFFNGMQSVYDFLSIPFVTGAGLLAFFAPSAKFIFSLISDLNGSSRESQEA